MYLLLGLSSLCSQNSRTFLKNCYVTVVPFTKLTKTSCLTALVQGLSPHFRKKAKPYERQKSQESWTNMDIILLFLAKPLDKHGTTLIHITYPPLKNIRSCNQSIYLFMAR